jgi:cobalt-zinc-cadmium efflux system outer membrane protein
LGDTLTIDAAIEQFVEHNYDLNIARHEAQKSYANLITAKERPNPTLNGSYEFMNINQHFNDTARGSNGQATLILSHPIETAGKRDRRIDLANRYITYNDLMVDETIREQLYTLIDAYYAVVSDQTTFDMAQENAKAYEHLVTIAKTKLDHGFLSAMDYQKIILQKSDYTREVENSHLALIQDREKLSALLALPSSETLVVAPSTIEAIPPIEGLLTKIVNRPDCKAAKENLALADASLRLEKANGIPNINIGMEYASFGPYYEPLAGLNFSVPLPLYDRNEGDIEKARIGTLQALPIYDKAIRNAQSDVIQTYEATQSRQRILRSMQEGFDSAKNLKENHEKIFILKGMSILELLDAQRSYREYQKNLIQATIDLHVSTAQLKLASGQLLTDSKGH